jgi:hypothetical protein
MYFKCNFSYFNLQGFIDIILDARKSDCYMRDHEGIEEFFVINQDDCVDMELSEEDERDIKDELVNRHFRIFFPFADSSTDKHVMGVDDKIYHKGDNEVFAFDTYGYLAHVCDEEIYFEVVKHCHPVSNVYPNIIRIDIYNNEELYDGMDMFLQRFIRKHRKPRLTIIRGGRKD